MQWKSRRRFLCILLMFVMLLSGICSPGRETDSLFSAADHRTSVSITDILSRVVTSFRACTNEMLGHQESVDLVRRSGQPAGRNAVRVCMYVLFPQILLRKPLRILKAIPEALSCLADFHTATVRYVHRQDGKKEIPSLFVHLYAFSIFVYINGGKQHGKYYDRYYGRYRRRCRCSFLVV